MRAMKAVLIWITALAVCLLSAAALAENVEITSTVPSAHTITVVCGEGGGVSVFGGEYTGTSRFRVARFANFSLTAVPGEGFELVSLTTDYPGGLTLTDDTATIYKVRAGATVRVSFQKSREGEQADLHELGEAAKQLHADYLGDDGGAGDLVLLFDKDYAPDSYKLLLETYPIAKLRENLPPDMDDVEREAILQALSEALPDTARVIAQPDERANERGEPVYSHRNLLIGGAQLNKLESQGIKQLALENQLFDASLTLSELREGNIAKLMALMYERGAEALIGLTTEALDELEYATTWMSAPYGEAPRLTYDMFADAVLEMRVTPIREDELERAITAEPYAAHEPAERWRMDLGYLTLTEYMELGALKPASPAYRAQVFLTVNGVEANITHLLTTLKVSVSARELMRAERSLGEGARERLLKRAALASIDTAGDIGGYDYRPGMYTEILDTRLEDGEHVSELLMRALAETLQEQYEVIIEDGRIALASRTLTAPRAIIDADRASWSRLGERLTAYARTSGLYIAVYTGE